jgi:hypothetical protein
MKRGCCCWQEGGANLMVDESLPDSEPTLTLFKSKMETKYIAIGIILASAYGMSALLPLSVFIGAAGSLSFAICIAPLFGIFLGPLRGFVFGLVGGIIASLLASTTYLAVWTVLFGPAMAGLFAGFCLNRSTKIRSISIPGPILTTVFFVIMVILYLIPNWNAWWFILPHFTAGLVALLLQIKNIDFDATQGGVSKYSQFLPLALIGTMADHSMMMLGAVYLLPITTDVFGFIIFPVMIIERLIAAIVCTIIASAVLKAFEHELF